MTYRPSLAIAIALVVLGGTASAGTEPAPPPTVDAALTVRFTAGKSTYAVGELIPLELEFRGRAGPDHFFSTGQMRRERYVVTPEGGADDPLREYYSSVGVVGGGLSGWHPLDGTPFVLRVQLNEWVRFRKPGTYRLVVESRRLERYSREPAPAVVSRPVTLHVETATPEWAAAEVARAVAALEGRGPGTSREAVAILRHLGTKDASLALVRLYGTGGDRLRFDWTAGLAASPHRAEIVEAMEARVDAGEPPPAGFVRDLALLRSFLDLPGGSYEARFERQKAAECDYARRSLESLGHGNPSTEALEAALAALEEAPEPACETSLPLLLGAHPAAAREAFLALRRPTQALLLGYRWSSIAGPWLQPALEAVYDRWRGDFRFPGVGDAALRRLAEMDPARGRSLAIDEVRTGGHGIVPETLTSLLGEPVPDLDEALRERHRAARTEEGQAATMELIARYGSARLLPLVRVEIDRDPFCALEAAALAYLLDHDPPPALRRLQPGFDRRRSGMCVVPPWSELAPLHWDQAVEAAAIAHLQGESPRLVSDAAQILGAHGSARAKGPLLERLVRWNEEWRGRAAELAALVAGPTAFDSPVVVENFLVNALLDGRAFSLTKEETERVRDLCLTRACRDNVDARARSRPAR